MVMPALSASLKNISRRSLWPTGSASQTMNCRNTRTVL